MSTRADPADARPPMIKPQETTMLPAAASYDDVAAAFEWRIPPQYNIGVDVCDKWADGSGRLALICETREGHATRYTFDELKSLSDRFANALRDSGVKKGDRVGI